MSEKWDYTCYGGTTTADRPFAHAEVGVVGSMELVCCLDGDYEEKPKLKKRAALIAAAPELLDALQTILDNSVIHGIYREKAEKAIQKALGMSDVSDQSDVSYGKENEND